MKIFLRGRWRIKKIILLISIALLFCGCSLNKSIEEPRSAPIASNHEVETFQEYFWYKNPVVLMLHVALMLAGAIGVVALLPTPYEEETNE
jgi:hypothetical protein